MARGLRKQSHLPNGGDIFTKHPAGSCLINRCIMTANFAWANTRNKRSCVAFPIKQGDIVGPDYSVHTSLVRISRFRIATTEALSLISTCSVKACAPAAIMVAWSIVCFGFTLVILLSYSGTSNNHPSRLRGPPLAAKSRWAVANSYGGTIGWCWPSYSLSL